MNACWAAIPSYLYPTPDKWPEEPPSEDSVYVFKRCYAPDGAQLPGVWEFITPGDSGLSLEELAWEAFGELVVPDFTLAHSPPVRAVIFVDTWWWVEGPSDGEVRGSSAGGVVAIAEPARLEVDPGD
ncbi:hypothetical protein, partial [Streptomyces sp. ST2-7A]|uniref:hypothetical protein n=1 Tax=Streptomyces sp. ST2-7A TaxID=2907214 RepID=UPI001F277E54